MHQTKNTTQMFGFGFNDEKTGTQIPTQAQSIVEGSGSVMVTEFKPVPDVDYLQVSDKIRSFRILMLDVGHLLEKDD